MATIDLLTSVRNAMLQELADVIDAANPTPSEFRIYGGTRPETTGGAVTDQTLLATCVCSVPCGAVAGGVLTFATIAEESNAPATGEATWGRLVDGAEAFVADFDVDDAAGKFIVVNKAQIYQGGTFRINAASITI